MLTATLLPGLEPLPFHAQLMYVVLVGSGLLCLGVVGVGAVFRWRQRTIEGLPPRPDTFPCALDQAYTAFFMLFLLWSAAAGLSTAQVQSLKSGFGWMTLLLGIAAQAGIYLPMLVRYALTHPLQRPTRPWWHYLTMPLLFWLSICFLVILLESGGFSSWLVRVTGCPEYQDLVLIFSRGDTMQRLYIIICAVLVAPVAEECCFRGFLYTGLRRWGGRTAAAIASALLFGAIHGSLAQMMPLTIFGIMQCIAYEKARSLWLPIGVHMLFNAASLIATAIMLP